MKPSLPCLNLPVYTKGGRYLGRIVEVEIDASAQQVVYYHVAVSLFWGRLWRKRLLISPNQVLSLSSDAMIVDDNVKTNILKVTSRLVSESS